MLKKFTITILTLVMMSTYIQPIKAAEFPAVHTDHFIVMDAKTGNVLYGKNINEKVYPASTTKIMTILLALKYGDMNKTVKMTQEDIDSLDEGASTIYLTDEEELTMEEALYAAGIPSANDACMGISHTVANSTAEFIDMMNNEAKSYGANNTHFANPHGLHDDNHYTTPYDLALIMKNGITIDGFKKYLSTYEYTIPMTNTSTTRVLNGFNQLIIPTSPYYLENVKATKTGFTYEANYTLITYLQDNEQEYIIAVFDEDSNINYYEDTHTLFDYVRNNYSNLSIDPTILTIDEFTLPESYHFYNKDFYTYTLPTQIYANNSDDLPISAHLNFDLFNINAVKGDQIGTIEVTQNDSVIDTIPVYLTTNIFKFDWMDGIMWLLFFILAITFLFISGIVSLRHIVRFNRRRRKKKLTH